MRGEDHAQRPLRGLMVGSPPHARGRRARVVPFPACSRITPACAGKTEAVNPISSTKSDHPRMRGEDRMPRNLINPLTGSPPHARGRPGGFAFRAVEKRITPACAGKTAGASSPQVRTTDHPRMRGEDTPLRLADQIGGGSPPHARGRRSSRSIAMHRMPDHPRMRGEDRRGRVDSGGGGGSPPHARGRPCRPTGSRSTPGITPACAGKTRPRRRRRARP